MNNRGQTMGITIISAIMIFIIGMMSINFILGEVTTARTDLSCSDSDNISDGTKILCLLIDTNVPYFILLVFSISFGAIIARLNIK